jgi:hypothetical protein
MIVRCAGQIVVSNVSNSLGRRTPGTTTERVFNRRAEFETPILDL